MWELTVEFHPSKGSGRVERNIQPGKEENLQRCFRSVLWRVFNLDKQPQDRNHVQLKKNVFFYFIFSLFLEKWENPQR